MNARQVRPPSRMGGLAALLGVLLLTSGAFAGEFFEADGAAIRGYDPVAYFTQQHPVKGSVRYAGRYKGSLFHFASQANRDAFQADPAAFAPQYGGFCAYGMALGYKAKVEPDAFTIVEGKLYLNYDTGVRSLWSKDISGNLKKADRNWPTVMSSTMVVR